MIHISQSAANEIERLKSKRSQSELLFRLSVKQGGCSGLFYDLSFISNHNLEDVIYESQGIKVAIDAGSLKYVEGLKLDYAEDLMGGGFRFQNPQAVSSCGCGNSFSQE
ncbi:HesB/IscA family protein [Mastigocoleus testarum]|uniref:Core domain-containing protein n=1 Tax=Mastigocoleus testarum BC008 TaxID=371196 RepID=A0A0V7ZXW2_9CYAN|nr:iron-sulfur cluster assembly accessory protein [Mastigocoleus testarum]KST62515.1 hypothetical protein BC008_10120 [Mastigocoleus testarum BC008]KST69135.1 hypothetical protein BC008_35075 [Mastigocoleus testarum BC008]